MRAVSGFSSDWAPSQAQWRTYKASVVEEEVSFYRQKMLKYVCIESMAARDITGFLPDTDHLVQCLHGDMLQMWMIGWLTPFIFIYICLSAIRNVITSNLSMWVPLSRHLNECHDVPCSRSQVCLIENILKLKIFSNQSKDLFSIGLIMRLVARVSWYFR